MFEVNLTSNYVPIGSKSSYPVQKFLLGAFLLGPKVPIGRVPIGLTDEFIGLKNSSINSIAGTNYTEYSRKCFSNL